MTLEDIDEYLEIAEAYRDALRKLYEAMVSCQVQALSNIMDTMDALESGVSNMIEDFSRSGAYEREGNRLSVERLEEAYPYAKSKVRKLVSLMQEARGTSHELSEFQQEIAVFYQEEILSNTYDVKKRRG